MSKVFDASPETAYATKPNIHWPESTARGDAAQVQAVTEFNSRFPQVTITAATIKRGN